jgi:hypothetical protein
MEGLSHIFSADPCEVLILTAGFQIRISPAGVVSSYEISSWPSDLVLRVRLGV